MNTETSLRLLDLNRRFYADFAEPFSATRHRIQPGVRSLLPRLSAARTILDLGCGNGELARVLAAGGFTGAYTGLDFSPPLLADARSRLGRMQTVFIQGNLAAPDWDQLLGPSRFSLVTAFAALHHIPGLELRLALLARLRVLLEPGAAFIHSNWQFLNSERLRRRIQPWQAAGFAEGELDEGDYLLDWRSGGAGLRYVHHFSPHELANLATLAGFKVMDTFFSDGESGRLGLYQIWERDENKR